LSHTYDPYAFVRDAYLQRRAYLVSDGKVSNEDLVDPDADLPAGTAPSDDKPITPKPPAPENPRPH
jgi:ABC-type transporter lipoprotein component MlaA